MPKYVVSSTVDGARWSNTTLLKGDAVKEISELKRRVDGEILVYAAISSCACCWLRTSLTSCGW